MGTSLTGLTPATTYDALIKVGDNGPITSTLKTLSDGLGNDLPMEASTTAINFTNGLQQGGVAVPTASQVAAKQDTLVSGTNIKTINGTSILGAGNIVTPTTSPSGVAGAIQFSDGSAFASDAANFFWDNTNKRLGIGTNTPSQKIQANGNIQGTNLISTSNVACGNVLYNNNFYCESSGNTNIGGGQAPATARLQVKGSGSTSATTSLLVQDSASTNLISLRDDGVLTLFAASKTGQVVIDGGSNSGVYAKAYNSQSDNIIRYKDFNGNQCMTLTMTGSGAGSLVVNSSTNNASAVLQADSTTKGFLPPRMTTTQKNAIATPAAGLVVYDTTTNKLCCYNGSTWNDLF